MAANESDTLTFNDDFDADRRKRMNAEVYRSNCVLTFRQMEHISSFSRATILNIRPKQPKVSGWSGGIFSTGIVIHLISI